MTTYKIYIQPSPLYYSKVQWVLYLIEMARGIHFEFIPIMQEADLTIGEKPEHDVVVSTAFYDKLSLEMFEWSFYFEDQLMLYNALGQEDILSTIFYLVNCVQEYNPDPVHLDRYQRFQYEASVQYHFNITSHNYVIELIDSFLMNHRLDGGKKQQSNVLVTHDIDFLTSGFRQEFTTAIKAGNFGLASKFLVEKLRGQSPWNNTHEVASLDKKMGVQSMFYWIDNQRSSKDGIVNADYRLTSEMLLEVAQLGMDNGLHKSASDYSFRKELGDFPVPVKHNRNHFLKFNLPHVWEEMEKNKISTDSSLGWSRAIGFRNSYGLPFYPYNMKLEIPYRTLVIPLQIMDVALSSHGSGDRHKVVAEVVDFIKKNNEDSLLTLLFHNNELTPYSNKYMLDAYKDIIDIIKEMGLEIISMDQVMEYYG